MPLVGTRRPIQPHGIEQAHHNARSRAGPDRDSVFTRRPRPQGPAPSAEWLATVSSSNSTEWVLDAEDVELQPISNPGPSPGCNRTCSPSPSPSPSPNPAHTSDPNLGSILNPNPSLSRAATNRPQERPPGNAPLKRKGYGAHACNAAKPLNPAYHPAGHAPHVALTPTPTLEDQILMEVCPYLLRNPPPPSPVSPTTHTAPSCAPYHLPRCMPSTAAAKVLPHRSRRRLASQH